jgi:hypothetical protein
MNPQKGGLGGNVLHISSDTLRGLMREYKPLVN